MTDRELSETGSKVQEWKTILERISAHFENNNFGDYVNLLQHPLRLMMINFIGGISRGVGIGLGFTLIAAMLIWLLSWLTRLHLPVIGSFIADIVRIVQAELHTPTV
ncbi:MAG: hypothetical protein JWN30_1205 [Bacilli bacterium]|nr:hypothetical protein [Bacilli bacterium]